MPQQVLTDGGMASAPKAHFDAHRDIYDYIQVRLARTRESFEESDNPGELLRHSTEYAVISVQTKVSNHEPAFIDSRDVSGQDELADVFADHVVQYHNNKARYIDENRQNVDFEQLADMLLDGQVDDVHSQIADMCLGLGSAKSAFSLAMLGFTSKICVDSHTANIAGMDRYASADTSIDEYNQLADKVISTFPELADETDPFLQQWAMFDADKGFVELHDPWFAWVSDMENVNLI